MSPIAAVHPRKLPNNFTTSRSGVLLRRTVRLPHTAASFLRNGLASSLMPIKNTIIPVRKKNTNMTTGRTLCVNSANTLKNIGRSESSTPALSATVPQTPNTPNRANIAPHMIKLNLPTSEPGLGFSSPLEKSIAMPDATTRTPNAQDPEKNAWEDLRKKSHHRSYPRR